MTDSAREMGEISARVGAVERNITELWKRHNDDFVPAMATLSSEMNILSAQNKSVTNMLSKLNRTITEVRDKQIQCQAAQINEAASKAQQIGAWAGLGMFLLSLVGGSFYVLKALIKGGGTV